MFLNMIDTNFRPSVLRSSPTDITSVNTIRSASGMPINETRAIEGLTNSRRTRSYRQNDYTRELFSNKDAPSVAVDSVTFLKAKSILSPVYRQNEAQTKYDMISKMTLKSVDIKKTVNLAA